MRILITGGAGFLGSHLAERMLSQGHEVWVIDNYETAQKGGLPVHANLHLTEGSVTNCDLLEHLFEMCVPDVVIHAAASYKDPCNWKKDSDVNVGGTINVIQEAQKREIKRFIYLQTALCYGPTQERPTSANHALNPITSYSISKTAAEQYLKISGLPYVSLRLANIYGARHYSGPIPTFYKKIKNKEKCFLYCTRRDFIDVRDFLRLIDLIIEKPSVVGCFNVSSGHDNSIEEIYRVIAAHFDYDDPSMVEIKPQVSEDVASLLIDPSETERQFGWKCEISMEQGVKELLQWYDHYGVGETYTHLKIK